MSWRSYQSAEIFTLDHTDPRICLGYLAALDALKEPSRATIVRDSLVCQYDLSIDEADVVVGAAIHDLTELEEL